MFHANEVIGEYRLEKLIAEGALGVVWEAKRLDRDEEVALKLIHPVRVPAAARKRAFEALTAALTRTGRLSHPNLQPIFGIALRPKDEVFGIAAKRFEGQSFADLGDIGRRETLMSALALVRQATDAIVWLHEQDLVHGNLKPSNLLVTSESAEPRVVITDLCWSLAGLGRRTDATRIFVSPEQRAKRPATMASDQWALARSLHQLAVHSSPGSTATEALTQLPLPILRVLKRALETDPKARFATMSDFREALGAAQEELGGGGASSLPPMTTPTVEVSVSDAVAVHEDITRPTRRTSSRRRASSAVPQRSEHATTSARPETDEHPPLRGSEAPTPQGLTPVEEDRTELGLQAPGRGPTPTSSDALDPSADLHDPTTPLSLQSINPSGDLANFEPPRRRVLPSDPTDVLPVAAPPPESGDRRLLVIVGLLVALAIGAGLLWMESSKAAGPGAPAAPVDARSTAQGEPTQPEESRSDRAPAPKTPAGPTPEPSRSRTDDDRAEPSAAPKTAADQRGAPAIGSAVPAPTRPQTPAPTSSADEAPIRSARVNGLSARCERKDRQACLELANIYLRGDGVDRDTSQARRLFGRACDLRLIQACHRAGDLAAATGRSAAARLARRYYERACDAGRAASCEALSALWRSGRGGDANERTADAFKRRACQLGHPPSCD